MISLRLALWRMQHYLRYRWQRTDRHGVHSPRIYALADQVIPPRLSPWGDQIEALRRQLATDATLLTLADYGAGPDGRAKPSRQVPLGQLAWTAARSRSEGEFLLRLVRHLQPQHVLELGTNVGIGTAYLAAELPSGSKLVSVEGSGVLVHRATQYLAQLGLRAQIVHSTFAEYLVQPPPNPYDLVLLDGHHAAQPTVAYVQALLPHMASGGMLIVDDIRWNRDMWQAWQHVQHLAGVSAVVERYHMGLLICQVHQAWERFVL